MQPHREFGVDSSYVFEDGLTFLRKQPPSSAVIASFGVLEYDVLCRDGVEKSDNSTCMQMKYIRELASQIKRVMHPFALLFGADAEEIVGKADFPIHALPGWGGIYLTNK